MCRDLRDVFKVLLAALLLIVLAIAVAACSGCHGIQPLPTTASAGSTPGSVAAALISVTSIPYLGIIAISGAVFIAFMGNPRLGMAVGAAGGCALAMSLAVIKYAWILGLLSVGAMIAVGSFALLSNRKFKRQMVAGVQNVKAIVGSNKGQISRDHINNVMADTLDPDATAQVRKIKKGLVSDEGYASAE